MVFSFVAEVTALINKPFGKGWHGPFIVESEFAAASYSKVFTAIYSKAASYAYYFLVLACPPTRLSFEMRQAKIQQGVI